MNYSHLSVSRCKIIMTSVLINFAQLTTGHLKMNDNTTTSTMDLFDDNIDSSPVMSSALAAITIIFGALIHVSNVLIIITVLNLKSASNPDALILSLSVTDYIMTITVFPVAAYHFWTGLNIPKWACTTCAFLVTINIVFSTTVVSLMTIDRVLAIKKPIIYKLYSTTTNVIKILIVVMIVSIGTAAISLTGLVELDDEDGYCLFEARSWYTIFILMLIYPQIPVVIYTYFEFVHALKMFDPRNHQTVKSTANKTNGTPKWFRRKNVDSEDKTIKRKTERKKGVGNQSISFKRCIRMSRTVAAVVILYYIPCLIWTVSVLTDWIIGSHLSLFSQVSLFLIMIDSSFNIVVYAVMCLHYRRIFYKIVCSPLRLCGIDCYSELPLGLTKSEVRHISNRMDLQGAQSPGIIRRGHAIPVGGRSLDDMIPIDNPAFSNSPNVSDDVIASPHPSDVTHNDNVSESSIRRKFITEETTILDSTKTISAINCSDVDIVID